MIWESVYQNPSVFCHLSRDLNQMLKPHHSGLHPESRSSHEMWLPLTKINGLAHGKTKTIKRLIIIFTSIYPPIVWTNSQTPKKCPILGCISHISSVIHRGVLKWGIHRPPRSHTCPIQRHSVRGCGTSHRCLWGGWCIDDGYNIYIYMYTYIHIYRMGK